MTTAEIHPEDLVLVDKRGREFVALVMGREPGCLQIAPLDRRISYRTATSQDVIGHWRKRKRSRVPIVDP